MLPKKGRKEIVVDGVLYHYVIKSYVYAIIRNSITGEIIKWSKDIKPKWRLEVKPNHIESIIRGNPVDLLQM